MLRRHSALDDPRTFSGAYFFAFLLSDTDIQENTCTGDENCTADSHNEGCPKIPVLPAVCTGNDSCTADTHNDDCPKNPVQPVVCTGDNSCKAESHSEECPMNPSSQTPSYFSDEGDDDDEDTIGGEGITVSITTNAPTTGNVGEVYNASVSIDGDVSGTWSISGADWLVINENGAISGTPTVAGSYTVAVTFTYGENQTANATFTLTITEASSNEPEDDPTIQITTETLATGVVGQSYTYPVQVSGSTAGTWSAENLPSGLVMNEQTGVISGTPTYEGIFTVKVTFTDTATSTSDSKEYTLKVVTAETTVYTGYVAQVVEIKDGWAKVKQTLYSYTIADLSDPPKVSASETDLTVEKEYTSDLIKTSELAVGDTFLIVVNNRGTVKLISKEAIQESQETPGQQGGTSTGGGTQPGGAAASGGGGGMTGGGTAQAFTVYSLGKLTVASVTSQEHMTVSITIDELDITKIYVGQAAIVSVDALGGEQFEAEITRISNSGENEGGNSKFTVELTLGKSGEMLPGMYSSAFINLYSTVDVPCIRVAALDKEGTDTIVYTSYDPEDGVLGDPVVITIGASDGENVQVVSGMDVGDVCYYEYYDTYVGSDSPQQRVSGFNIGRMLGGR